jgi:hypothetical protein
MAKDKLANIGTRKNCQRRVKGSQSTFDMFGESAGAVYGSLIQCQTAIPMIPRIMGVCTYFSNDWLVMY